LAEKWIIEYSYGNMTPTHDWSPWAPIFEEVYTDWNRMKLRGNTPMNPRLLSEVLDKMAEIVQKKEVAVAADRLRYRARKVGSDETIPCEIFV